MCVFGVNVQAKKKDQLQSKYVQNVANFATK